MKISALPALALAAGLGAVSSPAQAQSLRCGNDLVSVGDSRSSVLLSAASRC